MTSTISTRAIANAALWAAAGAGLTLIGIAWLDEVDDSSELSEQAEIVQARPATAASERAGNALSPADVPPLTVGQASAPTFGADTGPAIEITPARNPIVASAPPSNSPLTPTDLPNRRDGDASTNPAADLLDSARISCDFGAGNNTGLRFGETLTVGGGAQWSGDLLIYDLVNDTSGTARLTGSPAVTGSPSGEAKVQVTTEGTRVHLSGFLENRAYVMVTIFDELDNVGRHIAVMSRHEGFFSYASQFLGTCE